MLVLNETGSEIIHPTRWILRRIYFYHVLKDESLMETVFNGLESFV